MVKIFQIQNVDRDEFISILETIIEQKLLDSKENEPQESYTVQEVSKLLSVSKLTVYNYIKKGLIRSNKIGRKHIIKSEDLKNSLKEFKSLKYLRNE